MKEGDIVEIEHGLQNTLDGEYSGLTGVIIDYYSNPVCDIFTVEFPDGRAHEFYREQLIAENSAQFKISEKHNI